MVVIVAIISITITLDIVPLSLCQTNSRQVISANFLNSMTTIAAITCCIDVDDTQFVRKALHEPKKKKKDANK